MVVRTLMLLDVRFPLGLELTRAAVIGLFVRVNDQVATEIGEVAGDVWTLLTA